MSKTLTAVKNYFDIFFVETARVILNLSRELLRPGMSEPRVRLSRHLRPARWAARTAPVDGRAEGRHRSRGIAAGHHRSHGKAPRHHTGPTAQLAEGTVPAAMAPPHRPLSPPCRSRGRAAQGGGEGRVRP